MTKRIKKHIIKNLVCKNLSYQSPPAVHSYRMALRAKYQKYFHFFQHSKAKILIYFIPQLSLS
jgi:hypothetical protein